MEQENNNLNEQVNPNQNVPIQPVVQPDVNTINVVNPSVINEQINGNFVQPVSVNNEPNKKNKKNVGVLIIILLIVGIVIGILSYFLLNKSETLECHKSTNGTDIKIDSDFKVVFKNKKAVSLTATSTTELKGDNVKYKEKFLKTYKEQLDSEIANGLDGRVYSDGNKIILEYNVNGDGMTSSYLASDNYDEVVKFFKDEEYTCK